MKLLLIIGTRPEAIKMAGVVYELRRHPGIAWKVCSTGQHRVMLDETLADLGITADIDLNVMGADGLSGIAAAVMKGLTPVIEDFKPDWVMVQGDTTTAMAAALTAYHLKVRVGHVEAGLRTWNLYSPWPEEGNRRIVGAITARHFAPTDWARANLLREGIPAADIAVTGNTVIDSLLAMRARTKSDLVLAAQLAQEFAWLDASKRLILVTGHRRESFGSGIQQICEALLRIAARGDTEVVYAVHLNPNIRGPVFATLNGQPGLHLIEPQRYSRFTTLMDKAFLLLTDSGGIQEEGPALGKPVLVMRDTSERPEAIEAGTARLVGTQADSIVRDVYALLDEPARYQAMSRLSNPYGDGTAGRQIVASLAAT